MKKIVKQLGIIALAAVILFGMGACGDDEGGNPGGESEPLFSVSGKFDKGGGGEVKFNLATTATVARSARAAGDTSMTGVLEDGDFTIKLSGTYNPVTLTYSASAAMSIARYTINGAFDEDGNSLGSTATLAVKVNDEWQVVVIPVNETGEIVITDKPPQESESGGIAASNRGIWLASLDFEDDSRSDITLLLNQWDLSFETLYYENGALDNTYQENWAFLYFDEVTDENAYDVVLAVTTYSAVSDGGGGGPDGEPGEPSEPEEPESQIAFMKFRFVFANNTLVWKQFYSTELDEDEDPIQGYDNAKDAYDNLTELDDEPMFTFTR